MESRLTWDGGNWLEDVITGAHAMYHEVMDNQLFDESHPFVSEKEKEAFHEVVQYVCRAMNRVLEGGPMSGYTIECGEKEKKLIPLDDEYPLEFDDEEGE